MYLEIGKLLLILKMPVVPKLGNHKVFSNQKIDFLAS